MKLVCFFLLIYSAKISIKPKVRTNSTKISIIDNIDETISDIELYENEYMLMHEDNSKGKNVNIRASSIKR